MVSEIGCGHKSELDSYLNEEIEIDESPSFSITEWWKLHTPRFPILARLARDVLVMPISTVASESVFSTEGRIIDYFRASSTPKMAQALICCQDWMHHTPFKPVEEDYDAIDNILKGTEPTMRTRMVRFPSCGYAISIQPALNTFQVVVSTYYMKLKFPIGDKVGEVKGNKLRIYVDF
ncbi:putative AC transposase [Sesamum angolense]|uniref:AC transposase n=1 Tax=Sesamum angolense TaxID=2727404 RepID=A0AAE2C7D8_9LAMI|nr:putative AC transposase [Sesamum angolense]